MAEGIHNIRFLRVVSRLLHRDNHRLPDLAAWKQAGRILSLPVGGNGPQPWIESLARLGAREWHLYDREIPPVSKQRRLAVARINGRPGRQASLTTKRALENYLHPAAVAEVLGVQTDSA